MSQQPQQLLAFSKTVKEATFLSFIPFKTVLGSCEQIFKTVCFPGLFHSTFVKIQFLFVLLEQEQMTLIIGFLLNTVPDEFVFLNSF